MSAIVEQASAGESRYDNTEERDLHFSCSRTFDYLFLIHFLSVVIIYMSSDCGPDS